MEHYAEVRSLVLPKNLLEYRISDGWSPLCEFLDVPVPKGMDFPHVNDSDGFVRRCKRRNCLRMLNVLLGATLRSILIAAILCGMLLLIAKMRIAS